MLGTAYIFIVKFGPCLSKGSVCIATLEFLCLLGSLLLDKLQLRLFFEEGVLFLNKMVYLL